MRTHLFILSLIFILILNSTNYAQCGPCGEQIGIVVSSQIQYDLHNRNTFSGINVNAILLFINASVEHPSIIYGPNKPIKFHVGGGVFSFLQFQYGFNNTFRIRSDIVLFGNFPPYLSTMDSGWSIFRKGIVLTSFVDLPLRQNKSTRIGIGLGLQI